MRDFNIARWKRARLGTGGISCRWNGVSTLDLKAWTWSIDRCDRNGDFSLAESCYALLQLADAGETGFILERPGRLCFCCCVYSSIRYVPGEKSKRRRVLSPEESYYGNSLCPWELGPYPSPDVSGWFRISDYQAPRGVSNGASLYLFHAWKISTECDEKDSFVLSLYINLVAPLRINFASDTL